MNAKLSTLSLALVVALAACSHQDAPAAPAAAAATEAPSAAPAAQATPAAESYAAFELTMDKVDGFLAATKRLAAVEQADPSLDSAMNASSEDTAQYVARLEATPKLRAAIEQAGMSARDYALTSEALVATMMAIGAQEAGLVKQIPAELPAQHVEFVKANMAEIGKKMQAAGATEG